MLLRIFIVLLCLPFAFAGAADKELFTLKDPAGDDYGDGTLVYPFRDDMKKGDLDLISFSARAEDDGTLFEAVFTNNVVAPGYRAIDVGGKPLNEILRLGFYTFNIDVYMDKDAIKGSGQERTLPGRNASIIPENAWEKVVCLTPRPAEAETMLEKILEKRAFNAWKEEKGRVDPEDEVGIRGKAKKTMREHYFFPTRVRVLGKKISFFVPVSFLGSKADSSWHYVVAVTGTPIEPKIDLAALIGKEGKEEPPLMNLEVLPGRPSDNFGTTRREKEELQPPIVDLIVPEGQKQSQILRDYDLNTGRLVLLPGVKPQ